MSIHPIALSFTLLFLSSLFMMVAWYAHLKFKNASIFAAIFCSWGIAFFEYLLQVPANRLGHTYLSTAQLRVVAELFGLISFFIFSLTYLGDSFSWNYVLSFICILAAVYFAFAGPFS